MGKFCCLFGCGKRSERDKNVRFFSVPEVITHQSEKTRQISFERREKWLANIRREAVSKGQVKNPNVCSLHFHQGEPAEVYNHTHPDWAPTIAMSHSSCSVKHSSKDSSQKRRDRSVDRALKKRLRFDQDSETNKENCSVSTQQDETIETESTPTQKDSFGDIEVLKDIAEVNQADYQKSQGTQTEFKKTLIEVQTELRSKADYQESQGTQTQLKKTSIAVQTELRSIDIDTLQANGSKNTTSDPLAPESFLDTDKLKFYTGIPTMAVFMGILELISPGLVMRNSLTKFQQLLMTLIRLRLNLSVQDVGYRFGVHASTISRVFQSCIDVMFSSMKFLIHWPDREHSRLTLPTCFREKFSSCAVIIDCFEVFIDRPSDLLARAHTWSSYKHHNTAKFLIGITPQGTISFISKSWGDLVLAGDLVLPGDLVLADRGFDIEDSVGLYCAHLKIPAFTKGKPQLSPVEIEITRSMANVRIHVERVIGSVRQKYTMLGHGIAPLDYLRADGSEYCLLDKIAVVCCAMINCCPSVVALE